MILLPTLIFLQNHKPHGLRAWLWPPFSLSGLGRRWQRTRSGPGTIKGARE